jgi:hypothetical protein
VLHQIRVPRVGIGGLGWPGTMCRALTLQAHLAPQPCHMLAMDLCAMQQGSDPPVPIGRPCLGEARKGRL